MNLWSNNPTIIPQNTITKQPQQPSQPSQPSPLVPTQPQQQHLTPSPSPIQWFRSSASSSPQPAQMVPMMMKGVGANGVRVGGVADMELLAGEVVLPQSGVSTWSWWWWLLIIAVILVIIGLIIWWIIVITMPRRPQDISARDIHARDIAACGDMTVAGMAVMAGTTKMANAIVRAISLPPISVSDLNVVLDGTESSITLTNQSGSIALVTLPSAADNVGLLVAVYNETTNPVFHVDPNGNDTIEGSNATAVENSSALFISLGITPSNLANWKQLF